MEGKKNIVIEPEKGCIVLILKTLKKNNVVEYPAEIKLLEIKRDYGKTFEEVKNMKKSVEELRTTMR